MLLMADINDYLDHQLINPETGEADGTTLRDLYGDLGNGTPKRGKSKRTIRYFVLANMAVLSQLDLTPTEWRTVMALLADIPAGEGNESHFSTTRFSKKVGCFPPVISRAITRLSSRGIVLRSAPGRYLVNPWIGYNGDVRDWRAAVMTWEPPTGVEV